MSTRAGSLILLATTALAGPLPAQDVAAGRSAVERALPAIERLVNDYARADLFAGTVVIRVGNRPVFARAYGMADVEAHRPNTVDTPFNIGSLNKALTSAAVHQLAQQGRLSLADPIGKFLDGFPEPARSTVTIGLLLEHRSGYGDYRTPGFMELPRADRETQGIVRLARRMPLAFEPGTDQLYSNTGYVLLGAIIEKVTGMPFDRAIDQLVLQPMGVTGVHTRNLDALTDKARGYLEGPDGSMVPNDQFVMLPKADGGFYASAPTMLDVAHQLFAPSRFCCDSTGDRMINQSVTVLRGRPGRAFPIAGGFPGANTVLGPIPSWGITMAVFANRDEPVAEQLWEGIVDLLNGLTPPPPALPAPRAIAGAYRQHGLPYVVDHFDELSRNLPPDANKDLLLNQLGYDVLGVGRLDEALAIFARNTELFPDVANTWDSYAETWLAKGDTAKAIQYYRKALTVNPGLQTSRMALERLTGAAGGAARKP